MSDLLLILTDLQVADLHVGTIEAVDTPAVLLDAIDTVSIAADIIDVHYTDAVVGIDSDVVHIVGRTGKHVTIDSGNEEKRTSPSLAITDQVKRSPLSKYQLLKTQLPHVKKFLKLKKLKKLSLPTVVREVKGQ